MPRVLDDLSTFLGLGALALQLKLALSPIPRYATIVGSPIDLFLLQSCTPSEGGGYKYLSLLMAGGFFLYDCKSIAAHLRFS